MTQRPGPLPFLAHGRHQFGWARKLWLPLFAALASLCVLTTAVVSVTHAATQTDAVRIFLLRPSDVPQDSRYIAGITKVMTEVQRWYKEQLGGKAFRFNDIEEVVGEHERTWYENTVCAGTPAYYVTCNANTELMRRFALGQPDPNVVVISETLAENEGAVGNGGSGWVSLTKHDAGGAAGLNADKDEPYGGFNRWCGGMVHELGHAFGLDHTPAYDGTPMSGDFYGYPNVHLSEEQKSTILNGQYGKLFS
jgi:hypothetical protein